MAGGRWVDSGWMEGGWRVNGGRNRMVNGVRFLSGGGTCGYRKGYMQV